MFDNIKDKVSNKYNEASEKMSQEKQNYEKYYEKLKEDKEKYSNQMKEQLQQEKKEYQKKLKDLSADEFEKRWQQYRDEKAKLAEEQLRLKFKMMDAKTKLQNAGQYVDNGAQKVKETFNKISEKVGSNDPKAKQEKEWADNSEKYKEYTQYQTQPVYGQSLFAKSKNLFGSAKQKLNQNKNFHVDLDSIKYKMQQSTIAQKYRKLRNFGILAGVGIFGFSFIHHSYKTEIKYQDQMKNIQENAVKPDENKTKEQLLNEVYLLEQQKSKLLTAKESN